MARPTVLVHIGPIAFGTIGIDDAFLFRFEELERWYTRGAVQIAVSIAVLAGWIAL